MTEVLRSAETAEVLRPAFEELIPQAAQREVFYNDTSVRVLALARASPHAAEVDGPPCLSASG